MNKNHLGENFYIFHSDLPTVIQKCKNYEINENSTYRKLKYTVEKVLKNAVHW